MAENETEAGALAPAELRHPREPSNAAGQLHVSSFESSGFPKEAELEDWESIVGELKAIDVKSDGDVAEEDEWEVTGAGAEAAVAAAAAAAQIGIPST